MGRTGRGQPAKAGRYLEAYKWQPATEEGAEAVSIQARPELDGPPEGPVSGTASNRPSQRYQSLGYRGKRVLLGPPLKTSQLVNERITKRVALAVFSSDPISSTAYATEEILRVVVLASAIALTLPISLAIAGLLLLLVISYRQVIDAYPSAGGAYVVSRDNFGNVVASVAGAALLIDYVLTVAVSVSSGVGNMISAFGPNNPVEPWQVEIAIGFIVLLAWGNLRGIREAGRDGGHRDRPGADRQPRQGQLLGGRPGRPDRPRPCGRGGHAVPGAARLRLGHHRADGRGGRLQRSLGLPASGGAQRQDDAAHDGVHQGLAVPGDQLPGRSPGHQAVPGRGPDGGRPARPARAGLQPARPRLLPAHPGCHPDDPGAGRQHLVLRLPAAGLVRGRGRAAAPPAPQAGASAGLLQRHPGAVGGGDPVGDGLPRQHLRADSAVRDRRGHLVHPVAGGHDQAALEAARARLALRPGGQRC